MARSVTNFFLVSHVEENGTSVALNDIVWILNQKMVNFQEGEYSKVSLTPSLTTQAALATRHWPGCPPSVCASTQLRSLSICPSVTPEVSDGGLFLSTPLVSNTE